MSAKGELKQKNILKKLFIKYFFKKLLLKKVGFSGFPEVFYNRDINLNNFVPNRQIKLENNNYYDKTNYKRDLSWKISNLELFLKNNYI